MKFLADESVDGPIIEHLRSEGHDVASITEDSPGVADDVVLDRAVHENVVLLTCDKDFGELVFRHRRPHAGVLLLRFSGLDEATKCGSVSRAVREWGSSLANAFSVLSGDILRIRHVPESDGSGSPRSPT